MSPARRFEAQSYFTLGASRELPNSTVGSFFFWNEEEEELAVWPVFTSNIPFAGRRTHTPRHPGCPERAKEPFPAGSSRTRRGLPVSPTSISSPLAQTSISLSQSWLFGRPYHMSLQVWGQAPARHGTAFVARFLGVVTLERQRHGTLGHPDNSVSILPREDKSLQSLESCVVSSKVRMEPEFTDTVHDRLSQPQHCEFTFITWIVVPVPLELFHFQQGEEGFAKRSVFVSYDPAAGGSTYLPHNIKSHLRGPISLHTDPRSTSSIFPKGARSLCSNKPS